MSRLEISNRAHWDAVTTVAGLAPRTLVMGGGGYNPWAVGRCWAGMWARLNGIDPAATRPNAEARAVLRSIVWHHRMGHAPPEHWFVTFADAPRPGPVRDAVKAVVDAVTAP
jgi:acetoin utilization protein AcuC